MVIDGVLIDAEQRALSGPSRPSNERLSRHSDLDASGACLPIPAMIATNSDAAVETRNLTKTYKDFWGRDKVRALDDLTLSINRGEVFGLLGPNGSGKSTTIKLLLGLIFPSRGTASVLGEPAGNTVINERIGFLPEESYLYKFLTGEETLYFYGKLFRIPK